MKLFRKKSGPKTGDYRIVLDGNDKYNVQRYEWDGYRYWRHILGFDSLELADNYIKSLKENIEHQNRSQRIVEIYEYEGTELSKQNLKTPK